MTIKLRDAFKSGTVPVVIRCTTTIHNFHNLHHWEPTQLRATLFARVNKRICAFREPAIEAS